MQTGQPGPMITCRSRGNPARSPKRAIACSWLPHTCITDTGARPTAATAAARAADRPAPCPRSRNFSSRAAWSDIAAFPRRLQLGAHVAGHQVVVRLAQQLAVHLERALDVLFGNPADRIPDVIEDVVARRDRLIHQLQPYVAVGAEEIDQRHVAVHFHHASRNPETHQSLLACAAATTACPSAMPPSLGGTRACRWTVNSGSRPRTIDSVRRAFWKQPPDKATGSRPVSRAGSRTAVRSSVGSMSRTGGLGADAAARATSSSVSHAATTVHCLLLS